MYFTIISVGIAGGLHRIHTQTLITACLYIFIQEYVPYYDRVASGLNWEATRAAVVGKDAAGAGPPGVSVSGI